MEKRLLELLKEAIEEVHEREVEGNRAKIPVGAMDDDLLQKHREFKRKSLDLKDRVDLKVEELQRRYQREMDEFVEEWKIEVEQAHDEFWKSVYKRHNLDPKNDYNVNVKERTVYQYIEPRHFKW